MKKINWLGEWEEILIMCPSQCERDFKYNGKTFTAYMRWRWEDPWQFSIIDTNSGRDWHELDLGDYEHDDYKKAQKVFKDFIESKNLKTILG